MAITVKMKNMTKEGCVRVVNDFTRRFKVSYSLNDDKRLTDL